LEETLGGNQFYNSMGNRGRLQANAWLFRLNDNAWLMCDVLEGFVLRYSTD